MNTRAARILAAWHAFDRAETRRDEHATWDRLRDLRTRERDRFAAERGWVVCPRFTTGQLIGLRGRRVGDVAGTEDAIDHRSCFAIADARSRKPRPVAIVSHVYNGHAACIAFADRYSLAVEILEFSWYMPSACTAVLLTRPD
jgi:hypothetical protein